jgi:DNA-binding MarR family transcriptional regulator
MSKQRAELVAAVMRAVATFQEATDRVDEAAATALGVNRTDLRCLGILGRVGPMMAGELARTAGLSPGATTTAVDRLARAGLARRLSDPADRRRVVIEQTPTGRSAVEEIWGPIGAEAQRRLSRRTVEDLEVIRAFLDEGRQIQQRHAERIGRPDA